MTKPVMIRKLIELRTMHFDRDKSAESRLKGKVTKNFEDMYPLFSLDGHLDDLYSNIIYCISKRVLNLYRYKSTLNNN